MPDRPPPRSDSRAAGIYLYSRTGGSLVIVGTVVMAARLYGTLGFAYVSTILLIYETAMALGSLGLADTVVYFIGRQPARSGVIARQSSLLLAGVSLPVLAVALIAARSMSRAELDLLPALPWLALLVLVELPAQPMVNVLLAGGHAVAASVAFLAVVLLTASAVLAPLLFGGSLHAIPIAMAVFGGLRLIAYLVLLRVYYPVGGERWLIREELRAILAFALPAGVGATVGRINPQVDKYVVGFLLGAHVFAVYNVAAWELPLVTLIPYAIGAVMQVRYVQLFAAGDKEALRTLWFRNAQQAMLLVVPLAALAMVVADDFIVAIFGAEYAAAATPFRIFTILLFHRVAAYGPMLQAVGRTRVLLVTSLSMLASNLLLTLPLTWAIGASGAALATVLSAIPAWTICLSVLGSAWGRGVRDALPWRFYGAVLALASGVGLVVWLALHWLQAGPPVRIAAASLAYLVLYVVGGRRSNLILAADLAFVRRWLTFGLVK